VRKLVIAVGVVVVLVLVAFRQRLFLRDPIAKVERNGMQQAEYRVYQNYFNDILVENVAGNQRYLVQARDGVPLVPGRPVHLQCLRGMACLTETNFAPTIPLGGPGYAPMVEMTSVYVSYVDGDGAAVRVALR
jgi:hypothetical protein